jgi:cell division protease FtsH
VHATSIARRMVGEFGMSPELGLVSADAAAQGGSPSSGLQSQIDSAMRAVLAAQAQRAEQIVREYRGAVEALADALVAREVLGAEEVHAIAAVHGVRPDRVTATA